MKSLLAFGCLALALVGCNSPEPAAENTTPTNQETVQGGTQSGIAPMTPSGAAIPNAPVSGAESVQGAGAGGTGMAAKDLARRKTAGAGAGSLGQGGVDSE